MRIKFKSILAFLTLAAMLFTASCQKTGTETESVDTEPDHITIAEDGSSEYRIVYSEKNWKDYYSAAAIQEMISENTGAHIELCKDDTPEQKKEIVFGDTSRPATAEAKEALDGEGFIIKVIDDSVAVYASEYKYGDCAVAYLRYLVVNGMELKKDFSYTGGGTTVVPVKENNGNSFCIDASVTLFSDFSKPVLFIGEKSEGAMLGYKGYAVVLDGDSIILYAADDTLTELGSKKIKKIRADNEYKLRLFAGDGRIAAYLLDDAEGYEPWPEIELAAEIPEGCTAGYAEITGYAADFKDVSVYESEREKTDNEYKNPVYNGYADPDVLYYDGTYYLYGTGGWGDWYRVHTSKDLIHWENKGYCLDHDLWGETNSYWAPDVKYINGRFYMVVSCNEKIGLAVSDSPLGPFTEYSSGILYEHSIDGHLFVDDDGQVYMYFVSWNTPTYGIYGVKLTQNMTLSRKSLTLIMTPTEEWECDMGRITEGPYMLKHNGLYYITYSGSSYESPWYAVGYAVSDSPLGTYNKYQLNPIMVGNSQVHGTGHHCIVQSPDGEEMLIVYHCHNNVENVHMRHICVDRIRFSPVEGEADRLEVYGPTVTGQPYPD